MRYEQAGWDATGVRGLWLRAAVACLLLLLTALASSSSFRSGVAVSAERAHQIEHALRQRALLAQARDVLGDLLATSDGSLRARLAERLSQVASESGGAIRQLAAETGPAARRVLHEEPHLLVRRIEERFRAFSALAARVRAAGGDGTGVGAVAVAGTLAPDPALEEGLVALVATLEAERAREVGGFGRAGVMAWIGTLLAMALVVLQVLWPATRRLRREVVDRAQAHAALASHERELQAALGELAASRDEARDRARAILSMMEDLERERARLAEEVGERTAAEERFRTVFEAAPSGLMVVGADGTVALVNSQVERLLGYERAEMVGRPVEDLVPGRATTRHGSYWREFFRAPEARPLGGARDLYARARDGREIPVEIGLNPIVTSRGPVVLVSLVDVTERKRSQEAIESANTELRRRSEEMEQFVYSVSHDLKSPIVTILGFTGHIVRQVESLGNARILDAAQRVERASQRLREIIDDLLELSRIGRLRFERAPVEVRSLVAEALEGHASELASRGVAVEVEGELGVVEGDRTRLLEVFDNLVQNALRYGCDDRASRIVVGGGLVDGERRLCVADDGPGIPPEWHEKVFGLFQRLTNDRRGTGVGLAIVKRVVEMHGGRVWVESPRAGRERGTAVWLALPAQVGEAGPVAPATAEGGKA